MAQVITSKKFTLQWRDIVRGFIMAGLTSALFVIQQSVESGELKFNWHTIGMAAIGGGVGYLLKNWLIEPAKVITVAGSNVKAEDAAEKIKEAV